MAGAHTGTLTITGNNGLSITASLSFTVDAPTYTASLSPTSKTFSSATAGYGAQTAQQFTLTSTGTGTLTNVSATITSDFEISTALSAASINAGGTATVSVRPKTGLVAGAHTGTLTITGDNGLSITASLSFTVDAAPTYTATLSPTSKTFTSATANYGAQTAQEFTLTNTGSGTLTNVSATVTSDFEISTALSATSINAGGTATVSVRPKTGLVADAHTGTLTITGDNGLSITASLSFTVDALNVLFDSKGGDPASVTKTVNYNSLTSAPSPGPTKTGYTLAGWYKEPACTNVWNFAVDLVTANTTLYAKWTAVKYAVVFKIHNDGTHHSAEVEHGAKLSPPASEPVRNGYVFDGWYRDAAATEVWNFDVHEVVGNIHLYAKWTAITYSIKYNVAGGSAIPDASYTVESPVITLPATTRDDYTFAGWYSNAEFTGSPTAVLATGSTGNREYWAKWTNAGVTIHTVSFNSQGGNAIEAQSVPFGEKASKPIDPSREGGWMFEGWYREAGGINPWHFENDRVRQDTVLYARWKAETYSVVFHSLGGSEVEPQQEGYGAKVARPANPTRTGYSFVGWYRDEAGTNAWNFDSETLTGNLALYAKWTAISYSIHFDATGGSAVPDVPYTVEDTVVFPTSVRTGYSFAGWYNNDACEGVPVASLSHETGNRNYWAKWVADSAPVFTVTFDTQGGNAVDNQTVPQGEKVARPANPSRAGYTFDGWFKEAAGANAWDFDNDRVNAALTLYARWSLALSADATLKALEVGEARLQPAFNPAVTEYSAEVNYSVASISINGTPNSADASVDGNGNIALAEGENILRLTVRAQDGTEKVYTVKVTRNISHECELAEISVNGETILPAGNLLEYRASCGETSVSLSNILVSLGAIYLVNGEDYNGESLLLNGDVTNVVIRVLSASRQNWRDYTLKLVSALNGEQLYVRRWDNVLAVNCNPATNGGYNILAVRWYRNNTLIDLEKFIKMEGDIGEYYAEVQIEVNGSMHRICPAETRTVAKLFAYPNPVSRGETLTFELPKSYIGGKLAIYTLSGTPVKQNILLTAKEFGISVADLPEGIYLFKLTAKTGESQTVKIIIE